MIPGPDPRESKVARRFSQGFVKRVDRGNRLLKPHLPALALQFIPHPQQKSQWCIYLVAAC